MSATPVVASAGDLAELSLEDLLHVEVLGSSRFAQPLSDSPAWFSGMDGHLVLWVESGCERHPGGGERG